MSSELAKRKFRQYDDWVVAERRAITDAANLWAIRHAPLHTVTVDQVEKVEQFAVGHVDYATKLALYVMEMVYGFREVRP